MHTDCRVLPIVTLCIACQDGLREKLGKGEIPTEIKDAPFVQIPLGVTEDRLVGTVDIEASMKVPFLRHAHAPLNRDTHTLHVPYAS